MRWQRGLPAASGWYWMRPPGDDSEIVRVEIGDRGTWVHRTGTDDSWFKAVGTPREADIDPDTEWFGPLVRPAPSDIADARAAGEAAGREFARKEFDKIIGDVLSKAWVDEYRAAMEPHRAEEQARTEDGPQAPDDQAEGV